MIYSYLIVPYTGAICSKGSPGDDWLLAYHVPMITTCAPVCSDLSHVQSITASRVDKSIIHLNVKFHHENKCAYWRRPRRRRNRIPSWSFFDKSHKFQGSVHELPSEMLAVWFRMKFREMVSRWTSELQLQAPNGKVETNAEEGGFEVRAKRAGSQFHFKVPLARLQGIVGIKKKGTGFTYKVTPGWDDSDLDT